MLRQWRQQLSNRTPLASGTHWSPSQHPGQQGHLRWAIQPVKSWQKRMGAGQADEEAPGLQAGHEEGRKSLGSKEQEAMADPKLDGNA